MNDDPHASKASTGAGATESLAEDIDPRFDPGASGVSGIGDGTAVEPKSVQQQLDEMTAGCMAWVRDKPFQALGVAAGLGFLLGRVGR